MTVNSTRPVNTILNQKLYSHSMKLYELITKAFKFVIFLKKMILQICQVNLIYLEEQTPFTIIDNLTEKKPAKKLQ